MVSAVLIVNPASGSHLNGGPEPGVRTLLEDAGITVQALEGPVGAQIARSRESKADIIVVDGGDGTISATIAAHAGGERPIGIIPGGTMNLLASDYGIPGDREDAIRVIAAGKTRPVDAGSIDGRLFLHTALTGVAVRMGVHRERARGRFSVVAKAHVALHAIATLGRDPRLTLAGDGMDGDVSTISSGAFAFVVGALEGPLLPRPRRNSACGGLTVLALDPAGGLDVARLILRGALGDLAADPHVRRCAIRAGALTGPRRKTHAMLDGEKALVRLPSRITLRPAVVRIFAAAEEDG